MNISPFLCQSVTDALRLIYQKRGYDLVNFLDDLAVTEIWNKAYQADKQLGELITDSGLKKKEVKHIPPTVRMIFIGVHWH